MSNKARDPVEDKDRAIVNQLVSELRANGSTIGTRTPQGVTFRGFSSPGEARANSHPVLTLPPPHAARPATSGVWGRVALGVLLGAALTQWSYDRACGAALLVYLSAIAFVIVTGMWGAVFAWIGRLPAAHVVALATILWGIVLGMHEVLPRLGDTPTVAAWWCASHK
jgi:hypothetical protein